MQLVTDVTPYELMKLRLLNASHQALGYPGYLAGYRYVHEAAADPVFADFLLGYMQLEARPTMLAVPGIDLDDYMSTLLTASLTRPSAIRSPGSARRARTGSRNGWCP